MESSRELGVLPETVAVAADVDDVTVMHQAIDERGGHHFIAKDFAPRFEAFVAGQDGGGVFVGPGEQLIYEHRRSG